MTYTIMHVQSDNESLKFNCLLCFKPRMQDSGGTNDHIDACDMHTCRMRVICMHGSVLAQSLFRQTEQGPCAIAHLVHLAAYHGVLPAAHAGPCLHGITAAARNSNHLHM